MCSLEFNIEIEMRNAELAINSLYIVKSSAGKVFQDNLVTNL